MPANSTAAAPRRKRRKHPVPAKLRKDFPLMPHPSGRWCKRILGKLHFFGRWGQVRNGKMERLPNDSWEEALELYRQQGDDLYAGRKPHKPRVAKVTWT